MEMQIENIVPMNVILKIGSEAVRMNEDIFNKEETYQLTMHFARQMKEKGLITDPELQAIDTMMRQKYQPIFVTFMEQI